MYNIAILPIQVPQQLHSRSKGIELVWQYVARNTQFWSVFRHWFTICFSCNQVAITLLVAGLTLMVITTV